MKRLTTLGALFAILALGVTAMVGVAGAAPGNVWLCAEKTVAASECLIESVNLETMHVYDLGIDSGVDCAAGAVTDLGWVGPEQTDEITAVSWTVGTGGCAPSAEALNLKLEKAENACKKLESVGAENLPWVTVIELVGGIAYDTILAHAGGGQPGYSIKCSGIEDKCLAQELKPVLVELTNLALEGVELPLVTVLFLEKPLAGEEEYGNCSLGGKNQSLVVGELLFAASINGVAVSLETSEP